MSEGIRVVGAGIRCALLLTRTNIRIFLYFILAESAMQMLSTSCFYLAAQYSAHILKRISSWIMNNFELLPGLKTKVDAIV